MLAALRSTALMLIGLTPSTIVNMRKPGMMLALPASQSSGSGMPRSTPSEALRTWRRALLHVELLAAHRCGRRALGFLFERIAGAGSKVLQHGAAALLDHVRDFVRHQSQVSRRLAWSKKDVMPVGKRARVEASDDELRPCVGVDANRCEIDGEAMSQRALDGDRQGRARARNRRSSQIFLSECEETGSPAGQIQRLNWRSNIVG